MINVSRVSESHSTDAIATPHCHSTIEVDCILEGRGCYLAAGVEHSIAPGDVFVFSNNIIHKITHIEPDAAMQILKVHFSPSLLLGDKAFSGLDEVFFRTSGFTQIPADEPAAAAVRRALSDMLEESTGADRFKSEDMLRAMLLTLCVSVGRYVKIHPREDDGEAYRGDNHLAIFNTIQYISQNLGSQLSLDMLARMANMSKNSYLFWFKHFNGISPYSYIQSMRILHAVDLLKNSQRSITNIAFECGYNSTVSFNKMFKKVMGCTPTDIRRGNAEAVKK